MGTMRRIGVIALAVAGVVLPSIAAPSPAGAAAPPAVPPMTDVVAGLYHSCGISSGAVLCWGTNVNGVLGNPSFGASYAPVPVDVTGTPLEGKTVVRLEADAWATCALTSEGQLACWGSNYQGVSGTGDTTPAPKPTAVTTAGTPLAGTTVVDYSVGTAGACALTATNVLACWGRNTDGQVGAGDTAVHRVPTAVAVGGTVLAGKTITDVSMRFDHACAVTSDGIGACWGSGTYGRLGTGTTSGSTTPVPITTAGTVLAGRSLKQIVTGSTTSCALATDSTIACWGSTSGATTATEIVRTGTPLEGKTIAELVRDDITCARTTDAVVACWGSNSGGQLGVSTAPSATTPVSPTVTGTGLAGKTVASIETGAVHTCVTATDGAAICWGENASGQLGRGSTSGGWSAEVVRYRAPTPARSVAAVAGPGQLTVSWTAPMSANGPPVTGYQLTLVSDVHATKTVDVAGAGLSTVVRGLTADEYEVTVRAVNAVGTSSTDAGSTAVATPQALPSTFAPTASWAAWTARQFQDVLGRPPSSSESTAWVNQLTATPTDKGVLVDSLRRSAASTSAVDPTVRLYRAFLGRAPDVGGLEFWIKRRRTGSWTLVRMADQFAASTEFKRTYGSLTNQQFVTRIYTDVLGRAADPSGVAYWTGRLDAKARSRGSVMVGFSESSEYRRKQAENTDLAVAYASLLGRQPTAGEAVDWVTRQKAGTTHAQLLLELLNGDEYTTDT